MIFTILAGAVLSLCHGQNSSVFGLTVLELNEILKNFDKAYDKMTDIEKRNFMNKLIERVEICNEKTVETCCLLERLRNAKDYVTLRLIWKIIIGLRTQRQIRKTIVQTNRFWSTGCNS